MNSNIRKTGTLAAIIVSILPCAFSVGFSSAAYEDDLILVQCPMTSDGETVGRFPKGSRIVRLRSRETQQTPTVLTPEFFAAADPRGSFDAKRVLFSGQSSPGEGWQIWEMNADGSNKRQVTHCPSDCLSPAYLPEDAVAYTAEADGQDSHIWVCDRDGSGAHQITFGPGQFQLKTVLGDGRLLITALTPLDIGAVARALYTLYPDGTGLSRMPSQWPIAPSIPEVVPLVPQQRPRIFRSVLLPGARAGYLICLDSRISTEAQTEPASRVRVWSLDNTRSKQAPLGDVPVEADGSFYVAVPADQPVRFELLGKRGNSIREQKGWVWTRPGEQRGCVGCHEDKARVPDNRWPLALKRLDTPFQLGVKIDAPAAP